MSGVVDDAISAVSNVFTAPADGLINGDPQLFAEGVGAPSLITSQQPGIVGQASRIADTAVAGYFGGPAGAAAAGAIDAGVNGAGLGGALEAGAISGAGSYLGGVGADFLGGFSGAGAGGVSGAGFGGEAGQLPSYGLTQAGEGASLAGSAAPASGPSAAFGSAPGSDVAPNLPPGLSSNGGGDFSQTIGTGATSGSTVFPQVGGGAEGGGGLSPAEVGPTGFPPGGGLASSGGDTPAAGGASGLGSGVTRTNDLTLGANGGINIPQGSTVGGATPGAAPAAGGNSIVNAIKNPSLDSIGTAVGNNANVLLPAALLGYQALNQQNLPSANGIAANQRAAGDQLSAQGATLTNALNTGKLPEGAQGAIDSAVAAAKASVRSQYSSMGLSGSTMEAQALQGIDQKASEQKFAMINNLVQTGLKETELGNGIYDSLLKDSLAQDSALSASIARFAAAAGGGGVNLRVG